MNKDQMTIKNSIQFCFKALERYDQALSVYGTEKRRLDENKLYSEEAKNHERNKALEVLKAAAQRAYDDIAKELATIKAAALAMENTFELTPELNSAIALVSSVGSKLPWETRENLVQTFVGQKQALITLQSMFEAKEIDTKSIGKYIFEAETVCADLDDAAYRLVCQPGTDVSKALHFSRQLEKFAELEGIDLGMKFASENESEYLSAQARAVMGLPAAE